MDLLYGSGAPSGKEKQADIHTDRQIDTATVISDIATRGGYFHQNSYVDSCGCACRTSKIWLFLYHFFAKFPTHQYTIFERKAPNFDHI